MYIYCLKLEFKQILIIDLILVATNFRLILVQLMLLQIRDCTRLLVQAPVQLLSGLCLYMLNQRMLMRVHP